MPIKKKNLFQDYYETVPKVKVPEPRVLSETSDYVEMLVTDGRTGAQYKVKERKPNGPQGNFTVPRAQAENRYRMIMGLPAATPFHFERPDDPFAEDREGPESMLSQTELDEKIRDRISGDIKRAQALMPTREAPEGPDAVGHEAERPERPSHTFGLFGTEIDVHAIAAKRTRESVPSSGARGLFNGPEKPMGQNLDPIEAKIGESRGLQVILTSAYRGLFGHLIADHIMTKSDLADRRPGFEMPVVTHAIQDHGLMKPWSPQGPEGQSQKDRPSRPEIEYAVGLRAINSIPKGPEAPDLQDLPKAEREALITAVGRTVLHALTSVPDKNADDRPDVEFTVMSQRREDIRQAIAGALKPDLVRGLVPQELLDRRQKDSTAIVRAGGSTMASMSSQRQASTNLEERLIRPVRTAPASSSFTVLGQFVQNGRRHKRPIFEDPGPEAGSGGTSSMANERPSALAASERPPMASAALMAPARSRPGQYITNNSRQEINDRVLDTGLFEAR